MATKKRTGGRQKSPLEQKIWARFSDEEKAVLKEEASALGIDLARYIRNIVIERRKVR